MAEITNSQSEKCQFESGSGHHFALSSELVPPPDKHRNWGLIPPQCTIKYNPHFSTSLTKLVVFLLAYAGLLDLFHHL